TCDSADYYNTESHSEDLYMPIIDDNDPNDEQYIGLFHTGAYQDSLGGYGCIQHCLLAASKHEHNVSDQLCINNPMPVSIAHTGNDQESLEGYGGIQHCMIPAPNHVLIDRDENGNITTELFAEEQTEESMLKILGYRSRRNSPESLQETPDKMHFHQETKDN